MMGFSLIYRPCPRVVEHLLRGEKKKMTVLTVAYERQRRGKFVGLRIPVASHIIDKPDYLPSGHPTPDIPL